MWVSTDTGIPLGASSQVLEQLSVFIEEFFRMIA